MTTIYPQLFATESAPEVGKFPPTEKQMKVPLRTYEVPTKVTSPPLSYPVIDVSRLAGSGSYGVDLESEDEEVPLDDVKDGIQDGSVPSTASPYAGAPKKWNWLRSELLIIPVVLAWTVLFGAIGDLIFTSAMFDGDVAWVAIIVYPVFTILWCIWQAVSSYTEGKSLLIVMWLTILHIFASVAWCVIALIWHFYFSFATAIIAVFLQIAFILCAMKRAAQMQATGYRSFCF